jgi:hypothetical protein
LIIDGEESAVVVKDKNFVAYVKNSTMDRMLLLLEDGDVYKYGAQEKAWNLQGRMEVLLPLFVIEPEKGRLIVYVNYP